MASGIRAFRSSVARLKRQGLISKTTDARRAQPYWMRNGKRLDELVKKYSNVATGNATVVKLSKEETKKAIAQGYKTVGRGDRRIIVPHGPEERVIVSHGFLTIKHPSGIERVQVMIPYHNLEQYLRDIQAARRRINRLKNSDEYFGFRFFGHRSSMYSRDIASLIGELEKYDSIQAAIKGTAREMNELYQNLEIIRFKRPEAWFNEPSSSQRVRQKKIKYARIYKKRVERLETGPQYKLDLYRQNNAERQRRYRERLKANEDQYSEYLEQGRKRKKKWTEGRKKT